MEIDTATFTRGLEVLARVTGDTGPWKYESDFVNGVAQRPPYWHRRQPVGGHGYSSTRTLGEADTDDRRWLHGALAEACRDNNIPPLDTITGMIAALETVETEDDN